MTTTALKPYRDDKGNTITYAGTGGEKVLVKFKGSNNALVVADTANLGTVHFDFDCDNGIVRMGGHTTGSFAGYIRIGQDSTVLLGDDVTTTRTVTVTAVEGQSVTIGDDVMIAIGCQVRSDDAHPIFDVRTGRRVNPSQSVVVGDHVWLGLNATVLGGSRIGDGTVIGAGAIVKGLIPNNCVAAGTPARVVRRDVAWERPHLSLNKPYYKPDASTVKKSEYWNETVMEPELTSAL